MIIHFFPIFQQLISQNAEENDKIIRVHNMKDDDLKAGSGYNPVPKVIVHPYIDKNIIITKEINDTIRDSFFYDEFKWDMETQAFALGPGILDLMYVWIMLFGQVSMLKLVLNIKWFLTFYVPMKFILGQLQDLEKIAWFQHKTCTAIRSFFWHGKNQEK